MKRLYSLESEYKSLKRRSDKVYAKTRWLLMMSSNLNLSLGTRINYAQQARRSSLQYLSITDQMEANVSLRQELLAS